MFYMETGIKYICDNIKYDRNITFLVYNNWKQPLLNTLHKNAQML